MTNSEIVKEIIDLIKSKQEYINGYGYVLPEIQYEIIANELNAKFEHEKKEQARDILNDLKGLLEGYIHTNENITLYEYYCRKYEVEL